MKILLLGGTGYIGSILASLLEAKGYECIRVGTKTNPKFILGKKIDVSIFDNIDYVFYLSWMFETTNKRYKEINVSSVQEILNHIKDRGIKLFFFSTFLANETSSSIYNQTKGICEKIVIKNGQNVIKLGSVNIEGFPKGGFYGNILNFYEKFGFLPKILPNKELFYKTDLNRFNQFVGIFKKMQNSTYICADEEPKKLFEVLGLKKKVKYFPVPWVLIYVTLKTLEVMRFNPKFRSDSLISIWGEKA